MLSVKQWIAVALVFVVVIVIFSVMFFTPVYTGTAKKISIKPGSSSGKVMEQLEREGIIGSRTAMKVFFFITGADRRIIPARYLITSGASVSDIVNLLTTGNGDKIRQVRIPDGASLTTLAKRIGTENITDTELLDSLITAQSVAESLGITAGSLRGYLLPDTYQMYERSTPYEVIDTLLTRSLAYFRDSVSPYLPQTGYSLHQVLTLASIVDAETNYSEEMARISGVYLNRLRIGMKLQADPTVQFAQPEGWKTRLKQNDLRINSLYNTYLYAGLPPGPINNPGKIAIRSVLFPEQHEFLFFVYSPTTKQHAFSITYSEHTRKAKEYYAYIRKKGKS